MAAANPKTPLEKLLGPNLVSKQGELVETASLQDKDVVGLYFSAHWCPPCRSFTPSLVKFYNELNESKNFEIVFLSSDKNKKAFDEYYDSMPWLALPYDNRRLKEKLSGKFMVQGIPTFIILDAKTGNVITKNARSNVMNDSKGTQFPWRPKPIRELLGNEFVNGEGKKIDYKALEGKTLGIYFSAHWCPPCKMFTPSLAKTYEALKAKNENMEFIFVSSDRSLNEFKSYLTEMPWYAIPFENDSARSQLGERFEVSGIPCLVMLDKDHNVITTEGRAAAMMDVEGNEFPWYPKAVNELNNQTAMALNTSPALILFAENVADVEKRQTLLNSFIAYGKAKKDEEKKTGEDCEFAYFYVEKKDKSDKLVNRVKELLQMKDDSVVLTILNIPSRSFTYSDAKVDCEKIDFAAFEKDYADGKLEKKPLKI